MSQATETLFIRFGVGVAAGLVFLGIAVSEAEAQPVHLPTTVPDSAAGLEPPVVSLDGTWRLYEGDSPQPWTVATENGTWRQIEVPGELRMQGVTVKHDSAYYYRKRVPIPEDFAERRALLRFEGVYNHARLWMNGQSVREHLGGFTVWDADVTSLVTPGDTARVTVAVTDRKDGPSYGSGYAKHLAGGILRSVKLVAVPPTHVRSLHVETHLNDAFTAGELRVHTELNRAATGKLRLSLMDPAGDRVWSEDRSLAFDGTAQDTRSFSVDDPVLWTAEDPDLYQLRASLMVEGETVQRLREDVGFREVAVQGDQLLVNGQPVKLRGLNRHDVHPTKGRLTTRRLDSLDVVRAKQANANFLRTSHYPPSEDLLEFADRHGLYVESESAVTFVGTWRDSSYKEIGMTAGDPEYRDWYVGQLAEMILVNRNHPSVVLWSIGNESKYGSNFQASYDYVTTTDSTRPVIFSYPGHVEEGDDVYDILSIHYPSYTGDKDDYGMVTEGFASTQLDLPALFDEWAHVPTYNTETLQDDPNVRNFWGQSMDRFWQNLFWQKAALGGAIWGMIDETFMLPRDSTVGYGEWGIVDVWRRKKPEFWGTKKAYSPVRLARTDFSSMGNVPERIKVYNRFDHTNLSDVQMTVRSGETTWDVPLPPVAPHDSGFVELPGPVRSLDSARVRFRTNDGRMLDRYELTFADAPTIPPASSPEPITVTERSTEIEVSTSRFSVHVDRTSGLLRGIGSDGTTLLKQGPYLHIRQVKEERWEASTFFDPVQDRWTLNDLIWEKTGDESVRVTASGTAGPFPVQYEYRIGGDEEIEIHYEARELPEKTQQVGLRWSLSGAMDRLAWHRDGYWSTYPEDHIGRLRGTARKHRSPQPAYYRQRPEGPWKNDTHSFFLDAQAEPTTYADVPFDFESLKADFYRYALSNSSSGAGVAFVSEGAQAGHSKVLPSGVVEARILSDWQYWGLSWGNYEKEHPTPSVLEDTIVVRVE
jgi:hypothetical protein